MTSEVHNALEYADVAVETADSAHFAVCCRMLHILAAEVRRLREQIESYCALEIGAEEVFKLKRDLAALRQRHDAAHANWMTAEQLAANAVVERDAARAEAARQREWVRRAVNATCTCGGRGLGEDCCQACLVWHRAAIESDR